MTKKVIGFSCIAWAIIAIWNISPAKAVRIAIPISELKDNKDITELTEVVPTPDYMVNPISHCDGIGYPFMQLIGVPGFGSVWAATTNVITVNHNGPLATTFVTICVEEGDTYYLYDLSPRR